MSKNEVAVIPQTQATPMALLQIAMDQGADLDKLERLMDMQMRYEANEARKAYHAAVAALKAENIKIIKQATVDFQTSKGRTSYKHATLANVVDQVTGKMCKHQLSHAWSVQQNGAQITVACKLSHVAGHSETVQITAEPDNSGNKNSIQAIASTVTYLQRYTLLSALGLATHDDDGRAAETAAEPVALITDKQVADLESLAAEVGANMEQFCVWLKVDTIENLPADRFKAAVKALEAKRGK